MKSDVECCSLSDSIQADFVKFKASHAVNVILDPATRLYWQMYSGAQNDKENKQTIVLLHGICGTAGSNFYLLEKLADAKFTCHSLQYPEYNNLQDWIHGLLNVLEYLKYPKVSVFASDLSGFLMLQFLKMYPNNIDTLILCNAYSRTDEFTQFPEFASLYAPLYALLPHAILRKIFINSYIAPQHDTEPSRVTFREQLAREFMANQLDQLEASQLASRIMLQMGEVDDLQTSGGKFNEANILIIETPNSGIPAQVAEDLKNCFPGAKVATMKSGGNFPFLSHPDELVLYIRVFLNGKRGDGLEGEGDLNVGAFYGVESE